MDWRDQVIADVGRGMGIEDLGFTGTGVVQLEFERRGDLFIEAQENGVLFYLTRGIPQYDSMNLLVRALQFAHYSSSMRYPLQVGLKGDSELFLCIFLSNEEFDRPSIEGVMQVLADQFDRIVEQ